MPGGGNQSGHNITPQRAIQVNLNHTRAAQDLLLQTMAEQNIELAIVAEPYRVLNHPNWIGDTQGMAAIIWRGTSGSFKKLESGRGFAAARWGDATIILCYFSPNKSMASFEKFLARVEECLARSGEHPTTIAGDFNAKSGAWGSRRTDARGEILSEWMDSLNLVPLNRGTVSTCVRWQGESVVNVTLASPIMARRISKWRVDEETFTFSDHRYIRFEVRDLHPGRTDADKGTRMGWAARQLNSDLLEAALAALTWPAPDPEGAEQDLDTEVEDLRRGLRAACDVAMPRRRTTYRRALYWWSEEIANARAEAGRLRRRLARHKSRGRYAEALELRAELNTKKRELKRLIRKAKETAWTEFLGTLNEDPWGRPYKMVTNRLKPWTPRRRRVWSRRSSRALSRSSSRWDPSSVWTGSKRTSHGRRSGVFKKRR